MENKNVITKEGKSELKKELKNLIDILRPEVIQAIKEARALGDLSENAEFDAAREKQGQIEDRINDIQNILENFEIIKVSTKISTAIIGSIIEYEEINSKEKHKVQIVGSLEADPLNNKISNSSPLGMSILKSKVGDVIIVQVKNKYKIKINKITN